MAVAIFPKRSALATHGSVAVHRRSIAQGLVAAYVPTAANGGAFDLLGQGPPLVCSSAGAYACGGGSSGFVGQANNAEAIATTPDYLKLVLPLTIVCRFTYLTTPGVNTQLFGVIHNNTFASPFFSYGFGVDSGGFLELQMSSGGSPNSWEGSVSYRRTGASFVGRPSTVIGRMNGSGGSPAQGAWLHFDADQGDFGSLALGNPSYGATSLIQMGIGQGLNRNPQVCVEYGLIYNRFLNQSEVALFRDNPYHWLESSWGGGSAVTWRTNTPSSSAAAAAAFNALNIAP